MKQFLDVFLMKPFLKVFPVKHFLTVGSLYAQNAFYHYTPFYLSTPPPGARLTLDWL